jgi:ATPase subunit of ABC transporter with duplicated ATPase domains
VGKTVLARLLAGQLAPSAGRCLRQGRVHYLAQQVAPAAEATVADVAGVRHALEALRRIEGGSSAPADIETLDARWDIRQQLASALEHQGLDPLPPETPARRLSGGQLMRVALAGALLSRADHLILDEPSNHLDRPGRVALLEQLAAWRGGLLVISHDRRLLDRMERIVELSPNGLRSYGGGYALYAAQRADEQAAAQDLLTHRRHERRRERQALVAQGERMARRDARGQRLGRDANQAKILLGRRRERSEQSTARLQQQQGATRERLDREVREAAARVEPEATIVVQTPRVHAHTSRRIVRLEAVELPYVEAATRRIDLTLFGGQRVGIAGANGAGKSVLLQVIAGRLSPHAGDCRVSVVSALLDQRLDVLPPDCSAIARLRERHPGGDEGELRARLAQLGLDAARVDLPSGALSGGERLKAALACVLYAAEPAPLLLLDEPDNHLDLPSLQALETMLCAYPGTLVVVSHDATLLDRLALTDRLVATPQGWRWMPDDG